jgi:hypothetical protein
VTSPRAATLLLFSLLVSCSTQPSRPPALGEAYVGPTTLNIRQDIETKSAVSATVKHGEKLEVLEYKRRFVRVRTAQGAEGWTDTRQLLTPDQMAELRHMAENAAKFPTQGAATVYEPLNMHTEPNRTSPSFWQVAENVKFDVIGHKLTPRNAAAPVASATPPPQPRTRPRRSKDKQSQSKIAPPAMPPAPKLPNNWVALSVPTHQTLEPSPPTTTPLEQKPAVAVPMDDWSQIRTKDGHVGWVLTRMLTMAIPDEVAQYAEGHRITSYFPLGEERDGDTVKPNWLWTTIVKGLESYEFDSFRVFVWSRKHHRYETAYIERKVVGHFPVLVNTSGSVPSFSLLLEDDSGKLYRKTYSFEGYRVRMVNKAAYDAPSEGEQPRQIATAPAQPAPKRSWYARMKDSVKHLFR